jgi:AcrR family transcriptional regulator
MAPEDRRAALIDATVPLLYEHGLAISTRQIAAAAGVAEGTIFGVFKDKDSLIVAALARALDPQPTLDALAAIDSGLSLRERLIAAADLIQKRFVENSRLMSAARTLALSSDNKHEATVRMGQSRERLQAALTEVIEPDSAVLRRSAGATARLLLLFAGANTYGPFADRENFNGADLVSLLLDGLLIIPASEESPLVIPVVAGRHLNENGDE